MGWYDCKLRRVRDLSCGDTRIRSATIKDVAAELKLDWHTVKALDQQYMEAQLKRAGTPGPGVIGIDEIAIM